MSQVYKTTSSSPSVATSYVTASGTAVPAGNVLNVLADSSSSNNVDGITSTGSGNTVTYLLTNRLQGSGTTVGATTADLITFSLGGSAAVYRFSFEVVGRAVSTGEGVGYTIFGTARTDGVTATEILSEYSDYDEDAALIDSDVNFLVSGNNIIVRATGVAGLTMNFLTLGTYLVV